MGAFTAARAFLEDAYARAGEVEVSTWVEGVAMFELAVLDLKEVAAAGDGGEVAKVTGVGVGVDVGVVEVEKESVSVRASGSSDGNNVPQPTTREVEVVSVDAFAMKVEVVSVSAEVRERWAKVLRGAEGRLEKALGLSTSSTDLSSRLDSRIVMLKDEIAIRREMLGIVG